MSFQADVARYVGRVLHPDLLDESGPAKPLRKPTVDHRVLQIRQFASALVHRGVMAQSNFTSLADLFEPERFKEAIRFFLDRQDGKTTHRLHNQANALRHIARHHCRPDEATLSALETLCRKLNPGSRRRMSPRTRLAMESSDAARSARALLGHRHFSTTERYYIQANKLEASRRFNAILDTVKKSLKDVA